MNNQTIEIEGKGDAGKKGGKPGNLYVKVFVKKHAVFYRKGDDLYIAQELSYSQSVLGGEIEIPTLEGQKILLKIPPGTEYGKMLRISGKGVPNFGGYGRGNMYIELIIKTPKKITKEQKKLLEHLKKEGL